MTTSADLEAPGPLKKLRRWVSRETTGGALLIGAAAIALLWANSPWRESYQAFAATTLGPAELLGLPVHLDLTLADWAADGLLAIFFFVVGVELKHEFVAGSLRSPKEAGVPMIAAVGGMVLPALLYVGMIFAFGAGDLIHGWAIPTATDIAFALAVLAVFGKGLPVAIRTFLLTLAVVDDLLAIIVIAVFYTEEIHWWTLLGALVCVALFGWHVRSRRPQWWVLLPLAFLAWVFMHESGVHATVAGVLCGFMVPAAVMHGESDTRTHLYEAWLRPWSSGIALPVFAFFSAGVSLVEGEGPAAMLGQPVVPAIVVGLVVGKIVGVLGTTWLVIRLTPLRLASGIGVRDLLPVGLLAGIGFTVSLLISELSFGDAEHADGAKIAILIGSVVAALLGALTLRWDVRAARTADMNLDGVADDVRDFIGDEKDLREHG
ncbi:Na+/H+ antiporter NhaA [Myceligenerans pegani]|uniref:Na(+)/H(+) antiporter NhaA n=1 Tax=Myceligenerans pegani TaxID=2776917 RepID=A0ABR9MYF1_9MICO|nr:Na+/H+ antiporter NhaA [Myceligenerans sp. TRM 65318]MBE1876145.1 Na+/H+ antiporter NhaA [Myceligenerans sp. TRM 65318]MBE3018416.1 Na+/H+ antiporter NhaA [Myceligenerans sp. TRM 65318]